MPGPFALDYFIFVLLAALGVVQMAAAYNSLRGLLFVRVRPLAFLGGMVATGLAFLWFFMSEPRNIPDTRGGLDGNEMAGLFALAAGSAVILTLLLTSLSNRSMPWAGRLDPGLDALRQTTYARALVHALKHLSARGTWTRP
jgi:hypothetical protein